MVPELETVELRWIYSVVRRWLLFILGCVLLAGIIAYTVTSRMTPIYHATVTLLVKPSQDTNTSESSLLSAGERLAITYSQMLVSRPVLESVLEQLESELSMDDLAKRISVIPVKDTQLIRMTVAGPNPEEAALYANAISEAFTTHIHSLNTVRYSSLLAEMEEKLETHQSLLEVTQLRRDELTTSKIQAAVDNMRLESELSEYQDNYKRMQEEYRSLQQVVSQVKNRIKTVDNAHVSTVVTGSPGLANEVQETLEEDQSFQQSESRTPEFAEVIDETQEPAIVSSFPYTATITLMIGDGNSAQTYGHLLASQSVIDATILELGLSETTDELSDRVQVEPIVDTQLIQLHVGDSDPARASLIANMMAQIFSIQVEALMSNPYDADLVTLQEQMNELSSMMDQTQSELEIITAESIRDETQLSELEGLIETYRSEIRTLQQDYEELRHTADDAAEAVIIAEQADVPTSPIERQMLYLTTTITVALMIAIGLAFLFEHLDDKIRTADNVKQYLGTDLAGSIGRLSKERPELIVDAQTHSPESEAFRILAAKVQRACADNSLRTLLITSPSCAEGKSFITANLAAALARAGIKVVAVDADLHLPRLHAIYGLETGDGLSSALKNPNPCSNVQDTTINGLKVLSFGDVPSDTAAIFNSPQFSNLINEMANEADLVIIDSPPILTVADATIMATKTDGVLLVIRSGRTRSQSAHDALKSLQQIGITTVYVVLNDVKEHRDGYYSYYKNGKAVTLAKKRTEHDGRL